MSTLAISCDSCGQTWAATRSFSVYQQQSVESCPCPECGAYTLVCPEPTAHAAHPVRPPVRALAALRSAAS